MNERENIRFRLMTNNLTSAWLINMLGRRGVETDRATMSAILAGTRKGPKTVTILSESINILNDYENWLAGKE